MNLKHALYLPSGRIFLLETQSGYLIECTEMRDVAIDGKLHAEVREATDPRIIWKHLVPYDKKWLLTVSTQRGCTFNCKFCDVAKLPFEGNLTQNEIEEQIKFLLLNTNYVTNSEKVKIGFARMGEPMCNIDNVIGAMKNLYNISNSLSKDFKWLPCFNSILPRKLTLENFDKVIDLKENTFDGFLHLQISCNSTDEDMRQKLFGAAEIMTIEEVIKLMNKYKITNRAVTLNFIVMDGVEVDVMKLKKMGLDASKFKVKLIPLNKTENANSNNLKTYANYSNYEKLLSLKVDFERECVPVVVDAIAKCEEAGLCCGQLAQMFVNN